MSGMGHLMVRGMRYEITGLRLVHAQLEITATRPGPAPELVNEPVAVFGEDGRGFAQGCSGPGHGLSCQGVGENQFAAITVRLRMLECD
jgi:hypothetical protein